MAWSDRIVDALCELKRDGVQDFTLAWALAVRQHPPRGRDLGEERPTLFTEETSLVDFTRAACEDAWHDRRPALRYLTLDLAA